MMPIRHVLQFGNPLLRKNSLVVSDIRSPEVPEATRDEIDHLDGNLFIDRIEKPSAITMMSEWEN